MNKKILIAIIVVLLLVGGFYLLNDYIYTEKQGETGFQKGYKDTTYTIEEEQVTLVNGEAIVDVAPGSATKITTRVFGNEAEGDLNGDGVSDIAFLLTQDTGGSGTFYYVVAALKTDAGYQGTNAVFLGDRIAPQSTEVRGGEVIVNYADRKLGEALTVSPSVGISKYFKVMGTTLVEVEK